MCLCEQLHISSVSVRLADTVTRLLFQSCWHTRDPSLLPPRYENLSITSPAKSSFNFHSWNSTTHALWPSTHQPPPIRQPPHKAPFCPHSRSWCWPPGFTPAHFHLERLLWRKHLGANEAEMKTRCWKVNRRARDLRADCSRVHI